MGPSHTHPRGSCSARPPVASSFLGQHLSSTAGPQVRGGGGCGPHLLPHGARGKPPALHMQPVSLGSPSSCLPAPSGRVPPPDRQPRKGIRTQRGPEAASGRHVRRARALCLACPLPGEVPNPRRVGPDPRAHLRSARTSALEPPGLRRGGRGRRGGAGAAATMRPEPEAPAPPGGRAGRSGPGRDARLWEAAGPSGPGRRAESGSPASSRPPRGARLGRAPGLSVFLLLSFLSLGTRGRRAASVGAGESPAETSQTAPDCLTP